MTNTMGAGKAFTKVELKRMPIFGWSFFFGEFIFLQRNWKEDEKRIGPAIDQLVAHPFPITLLLLPEGTRFTSEKYQAAMKFVEERKIPINLKYHLLPRVKGFAATLGHLQKNRKFLEFNKIQKLTVLFNRRKQLWCLSLSADCTHKAARWGNLHANAKVIDSRQTIQRWLLHWKDRHQQAPWSRGHRGWALCLPLHRIWKDGQTYGSAPKGGLISKNSHHEGEATFNFQSPSVCPPQLCLLSVTRVPSSVPGHCDAQFLS